MQEHARLLFADIPNCEMGVAQNSLHVVFAIDQVLDSGATKPEMGDFVYASCFRCQVSHLVLPREPWPLRTS